jgi:hypothetical protein
MQSKTLMSGCAPRSPAKWRITITFVRPRTETLRLLMTECEAGVDRLRKRAEDLIMLGLTDGRLDDPDHSPC